MLNEEGLQLLLATDFEEFKKRNCGPFAKSDLIHIMSFHHFPYSVSRSSIEMYLQIFLIVNSFNMLYRIT
jgi:hypothetical protein